MANGPDGKRFVWGRIKEVHEVGPYSIVEYTPSNRDLMPEPVQFHPYVDGKDTNNAAPTLDGALCLAIAHRHNVCGAGYFMMKLVAP